MKIKEFVQKHKVELAIGAGVLTAAAIYTIKIGSKDRAFNTVMDFIQEIGVDPISDGKYAGRVCIWVGPEDRSVTAAGLYMEPDEAKKFAEKIIDSIKTLEEVK